MPRVPTGSGPAGFSRCYIPFSENASSGGLTGSIYGSNRMLTGDPFYIGYLP